MFQISGMLALLSCEASAFIACLITLDRFIALRFPFTQYRFNRNSAFYTCVSIWILSLGIILTPYLLHMNIYGLTGVCVPLPVTRTHVDVFSFSIMIVVNFVLFVMIAIGQSAIMMTVTASSKAVESSKGKSVELKLARRLVSVVLTDFCCWFPIGVLGK